MKNIIHSLAILLFKLSFSYDGCVPQPLDQDTLDRFCVHLSRLHVSIYCFAIRIHSLRSCRIAGVDQGRGTLAVAKNISRLTMWEVVLFLTVSSNSGSLSLDSAVHRIVAHVKRWAVIPFACCCDLMSTNCSDFHDDPLVPCDPRIFCIQVGGSAPFFRFCFVCPLMFLHLIFL